MSRLVCILWGILCVIRPTLSKGEGAGEVPGLGGGRLLAGAEVFAPDMFQKGIPVSVEVTEDGEHSYTVRGIRYGQYVVAWGDIVVAKVDERLLSRNETLLSVERSGGGWTCPVPFVITHTNYEDTILAAIAHWEEFTDWRFVRRTTEANYLDFIEAQGCWSWVGMINGRQEIGLSTLCGFGAAVHEIGHALGLHHEQTRIDRDDFIDILWDNIIEDNKHNFQKTETGRDIGPYDFGSIMHYGLHDFAVNRNLRTMDPKVSTNGITPGQRNGLSSGDLVGAKERHNIASPQCNAAATCGSHSSCQANHFCTTSGDCLPCSQCSNSNSVDNSCAICGCSSHSNCAGDQFCHNNGICNSCTSCNQGTSFDGTCPNCACTSHGDCESEEYCNTVGECMACATCAVLNDAVNGACPACAVSCSEHCECMDRDYCDLFNACWDCSECADYDDPIDGVCPVCGGGRDCSGGGGGGGGGDDCGSHGDCGSGEYCSDNGDCRACVLCATLNDSVDGLCPTCDCTSHTDCFPDEYCDIFGDCFPCTWCQFYDDPIDGGQCPFCEFACDSHCGCDDSDYCDVLNTCWDCFECVLFEDAIDDDCPDCGATRTCGGGGGGGECVDSPSDWVDTGSFTCADHEILLWCTPDGSHGTGWNIDWGVLDDYAVDEISALDACCACGGGGVLSATCDIRVSDILNYGDFLDGVYYFISTHNGRPYYTYAKSDGTSMYLFWLTDFGGHWVITSIFPSTAAWAFTDQNVATPDLSDGFWGVWDDNIADYVGDDIVIECDDGSPVEVCVDTPPDWSDSDTDDCLVYEAHDWCTRSGEHGGGWSFDWGVIDDFATNGISAFEACCACGGGVDEAPAVEGCLSHEMCANQEYCDTAGDCWPCTWCASFDDAIDDTCPSGCDACDSHCNCGNDGYCDMYQTCYDCFECPDYDDAIDGSCPVCGSSRNSCDDTGGSSSGATRCIIGPLGTDIPGFGFDNAGTSSVNECASLCTSNNGCKGFQFSASCALGCNQNCALHAGNNIQGPLAADYYTYLVSEDCDEPTYTVGVRSDLPDLGYHAIGTHDLETCQRVCDDQARCIGIQYSASCDLGCHINCILHDQGLFNGNFYADYFVYLPIDPTAPSCVEGPLSMDIPGIGYHAQETSTFNGCVDMCKADSRCQAVQYSQGCPFGCHINCLLHDARDPTGDLVEDYFVYFISHSNCGAGDVSTDRLTAGNVVDMGNFAAGNVDTENSAGGRVGLRNSGGSQMFTGPHTQTSSIV